MNHHRNTVKTRITLNEQQLNEITTKGAKVLLYCGLIEAPTLVGMTKLDIAFPQQVEVKVNEQVVPSSQLKGLKNKPGSTRPPDVTQLFNQSHTNSNEVAITYALTTKASPTTEASLRSGFCFNLNGDENVLTRVIEICICAEPRQRCSCGETCSGSQKE